MEISSYNHIYELFAGISSALIGVTTMRNFVQEKVSITVLNHKIPEKIEESKKLNESNFKQFTDLHIMQPKLVDDKKYLTLREDAKKALQWIANNKIANEKDDEGNLMVTIITSLFVFIFIFCITLIIVGGLSIDKVIANEWTMCFLGNFCFFSLIAMFSNSYHLSFRPNKPIRRGMVYFFSTLAISILWTIVFGFYLHVGFITNNLVAVLTSIFICFVPLLVLFWRCIILWYFKVKAVENKLEGNGKLNETISLYLKQQVIQITG